MLVKSQLRFLCEVHKLSVRKCLLLLSYCTFWFKFSFFIMEILSHVKDIILD